MKYGNCLIGAIIIKYRFKDAKIKMIKNDSLFPHFYASIGHHRVHYAIQEPIMPEPFLSFIYKGKFEFI